MCCLRHEEECRAGPTRTCRQKSGARQCRDSAVGQAGDSRAGGATVNTSDDVAALGTILGVWAHPDDEAYLSGGLMALARDNGQRVVCVTATRGERGTPDPVAWPPERLAEERTRELARCLSILGVE